MSKGHFINGRWLQQGAGNMASVNPSTGLVYWEGLCAGASEIDVAVHSGRNAFKIWRSYPASKRIDILNAFADNITKHRSALAHCISSDTGKPLWESQTEVNAMANKISLSIKAWQERRREFQIRENGTSLGVIYRPIGVFAVLGPFNLPGHIPNGHIIPALLSGNTVIFKPSELAPAVGEFTASLWEAAGLPDGVFNMIQGGGDTGGLLVQSPGIDGLLFTGSYKTGKTLHAMLAGHPEKMVALELGGNNPLVIWNASDESTAILLTLLSAFITSGQRCTCARRLIVSEDDNSKRFLKSLAESAANIRVGDFTNRPEPFYGPVISAQASDRLMNRQEKLIQTGAKPLLKMRPRPENRALLSPGIIDITNVSRRNDSEWFGPLLQVVVVSDFESALQEAGSTAYGLSAGLLSDDAGLFKQFQEQVPAGHLVWNRQTTGASSRLPFGGVGLSGNHRPSGYFAVDYCSDPVSAMMSRELILPNNLPPGLPI